MTTQQQMHMLPMRVAHDDREPEGEHKMHIEFALDEEGLLVTIRAKFADGHGDDFACLVGWSLNELSIHTQKTMQGPLAGLRGSDELPSRLGFVIRQMIADLIARKALDTGDEGFRFDVDKLSSSIAESERDLGQQMN